MSSADRNYLLLRLRSITFGSELEATYTCPGCGESISTLEDLDELPVRMLPEGEEQQDLTIELEDGYVDREGQVHTALTMRLPTGADEEAVAPQMRENASLGKNALLARCAKSLGEVPTHRLEALGPADHERADDDRPPAHRSGAERRGARVSTSCARSSARGVRRRSPRAWTCRIF